MSMRYFIVLLCFFANTGLLAQSVPPLDRVISVDIRHEKLESALRQISRAGRFEFSYNPTRIDGNVLVTVRLANAPVREVLNQVFQRQVTYKSRGNHIILVRAEVPDTTPKNFLLDGYILDEQTGERIAQASIFEKTTLASTVSNPFGYYRLRLPANLPAVRLDVRKQAYLGETVIIRSRLSHSVSIRMTPQPLNPSLVQPLSIRVTEDTIRPAEPLANRAVETPVVMADSTQNPPSVSVLGLGRQGITRLFVSAQQAIHDVNLSRDTLYRDWQVSFLPFMGTNHRLSGRISNRISVNVLMGYSFGVRAFEIGGLFNLVRTNVSGFQAAGLGNIVGGGVNGIQAGGLINYTNQDVKGAQVGGLINTVGRSVDGAQVGGLVNYANQTIKGAQISGLINTAGQSVTGAQLAGLINYTNQDVKGVQIGGLINTVGRSVTGVQLAGLINYTQRDVRGWQIGSILNRARRVTVGHQIGLINIADTAGNVPFGLLSIIRKGGFKRIEVAANEVNLLNVTLRTGVRLLYNILTAGTSFGRMGSPELSTGYGLGTALSLSRKTLVSLEATDHYLFYSNRFIYSWNNQLRLSALVETKFSKYMSLAFGPSVNWYFSNDGTTLPQLQPNVPLFAERTDAFNNNRRWGWIGFQIGLRYGNL